MDGVQNQTGGSIQCTKPAEHALGPRYFQEEVFTRSESTGKEEEKDGERDEDRLKGPSSHLKGPHRHIEGKDPPNGHPGCNFVGIPCY